MLIKRSVNTLLKNNPKKFTSTFDKNKKAVSEQLDVRSKKLRNIIAGYLTKQVKAQKN